LADFNAAPYDGSTNTEFYQIIPVSVSFYNFEDHFT